MIYNFTKHKIDIYDESNLIIVPNRDILTYQKKNALVQPSMSIQSLKPLNSHIIKSVSKEFKGVEFVQPTCYRTYVDMIPLTHRQILEADAIIVSRKFANDIMPFKNANAYMHDFCDKLHVVYGQVKVKGKVVGCIGLKKCTWFQSLTYYMQQYKEIGFLNSLIRQALSFYLNNPQLVYYWELPMLQNLNLLACNG